ncbi:MAG: retroviral-like aspartic protease family protein [Bacteroidota bacterium]
MAIKGKEFDMDYDDIPPSLKLDLILSCPDPANQSLQTIKAVLLDTGADYTIIPNDIIKKLGLKPTGDTTTLTGWDNKSVEKLKFYSAKVKVEDVEDDINLEVVGANCEALIGRNLLNRWHILLNGDSGKNGGTFEIINSKKYKIPKS